MMPTIDATSGLPAHTTNPSTASGVAESAMMIPAGQSSTQVLNSLHLDYIHDVAFDTYGRRMATCSGDRAVRVWELADNGSWHLTATWQAHRGAVSSLAWAHPEFGSLLATCGSDQDAKLWEEKSQTATTSNMNSRWMLKASLTEARRAVTCVEFGPRHAGLKLAVGAADGCVRVYEAVDVMNLSQWPLAATLQSFAETSKVGVTSLSWSNSRFEPPTLVVGGTHVVLYRYSDVTRSWQAILQMPASSHHHPVRSVAWAPNVGRRFHLVAAAEQDTLKIYKLVREWKDSSTKSGGSNTENKLTLTHSQTLLTPAWRCQWNVTGTVLAASGDGGTVSLFKADVEGHFQLVSSVQGDLAAVVENSNAAGGGVTNMEM